MAKINIYTCQTCIHMHLLYIHKYMRAYTHIYIYLLYVYIIYTCIHIYFHLWIYVEYIYTQTQLSVIKNISRENAENNTLSISSST